MKRYLAATGGKVTTVKGKWLEYVHTMHAMYVGLCQRSTGTAPKTGTVLTTAPEVHKLASHRLSQTFRMVGKACGGVAILAPLPTGPLPTLFIERIN